MHRQPLLDMLARHQPFDEREAASRRIMIDFVRTHADCFSRDLKVGHLTGSAWLVNPTNNKVLLTHHRKLDMWLQLGGHADGESDLFSVAVREAVEESGISEITPLSREIFDLDVHAIPARNAEPAHFHYDVRFLLQAVATERFFISDESHALRWFTYEDLSHLVVDESVRRMAKKWQVALAAV